jgi:hypothetical protein
MLKISHCLDNRLTDGGYVSLTTLHKHFLFMSLIRISVYIPESSAAERIRQINKIQFLIGSRTRDLSASRIVSQSLRYRVPLSYL